jgi:hypothetical protein
MMQKYEIFTFYSKVLLKMYLSLKALSKIMNEVTFSWRMFKRVLGQVLKQALKNLALEAVAASKKAPARRAGKPQVDVDLKFFQTNLIPKLHKTLVTAIRQDTSAPLFNLILAMHIGLLQEQLTPQEYGFFFRQLLLLKDFQAWRKTEIDFVDMKERIPRQRLQRLKRELSRLYPDFGRQFVERLEADLGEQYAYADASLRIYGLFKDAAFGELSLAQEICLGFLCPDHEFKSKLTEFVYTRLSEVFEFSEEYSRLHQFLRRAAWKAPIALQAVSHVNLVNTLASIAQHYGVGLDVVRADPDAESLLSE